MIFKDYSVFFLLEIPPSDRTELFVKKLEQCRIVFDFNDASSELHGKQVKAQILHEMLDYITTQRNVITEHIYPEVVNMVCILRFLRLQQLIFCSLRRISSDRYPLKLTPLAMPLIPKKTNPS